MTTKLDKLLSQIKAEKARLKSKEKADQSKRIREVSKLVLQCNLQNIPLDFLQPALQKIAADYAAKSANTNEVAGVNHG